MNTTGWVNTFVGGSAGRKSTTGRDNVFIGFRSGYENTTGSSNTLIGSDSDVGAGGLDHATAIGADAIVSANNTIQIGRSGGEDTVNVAGLLNLVTLGSGGSTQLCRNASNEVSACSSSIRYKKNIKRFKFGLDLIKELRPVSFYWKADDMFDFGLVAEDVFEIEPLLTRQNAKGEVEGVKYDRLSVVLINAVKEQQKQIEKQRSEIEALKRLVCSNNQTAKICS